MDGIVEYLHHFRSKGFVSGYTKISHFNKSNSLGVTFRLIDANLAGFLKHLGKMGFKERPNPMIAQKRWVNGRYAVDIWPAGGRSKPNVYVCMMPDSENPDRNVKALMAKLAPDVKFRDSYSLDHETQRGNETERVVPFIFRRQVASKRI